MRGSQIGVWPRRLNLHLFDNLLRILTMADVVLIFRQ
jgi:hypothetical protein